MMNKIGHKKNEVTFSKRKDIQGDQTWVFPGEKMIRKRFSTVIVTLLGDIKGSVRIVDEKDI